MRVLFLNPPAKNFYGNVGANLIPLGIGYLASVLKEEGHEVGAIDLQVEPVPDHRLPFQDYDLAAISSDTPRFNDALSLGRRARAAGVPVVMGGYHPTFLDEEPFAHEAADFIIRGEGEYSLAELAFALENGGDLGGVRGLTYRKDGRIIRNPPAAMVEKLDDLPFPSREIFPLDRYSSTFDGRRVATVITSRGCPYDCYFCAASRFAGLRWRIRSLNSVIRELDELIRAGYSSFIFVDDNFTLDHRRTMNFCEEVIARRWDICWWCFSRVDTVVKHPEMVEKMALAGNKTVFLGLESGNQATLNRYQKRTTVEQEKKAVSILRKYGIDVFGSFILGEPHETREMIKETIRFARQLDLQTCQFSILTPYPGSRLFQNLDESRRLTTRNWDLYDGVHLVFRNPNLSARELQRLVRRAYYKFYLGLPRIPAGRGLGAFRELLGQLRYSIEIIQQLRKAFL